MTDDALNRLLDMHQDGNVCFVFADYRTCRMSESVFGILKNSNLSRIVLVGYSIGSHRDCTFNYQGVDVLFSEEEYDSVVHSLPDLVMKNGRVSAMIFTKDFRYSLILSSVRSNAEARLKKIDDELECGIVKSGMSKPSVVLALSYLVILLACTVVFLIWAFASDGDFTALDLIIIAVMSGMISAGIIYLIYTSINNGRRKWEYPDPDLAMVLSFIPGAGLIYMKKLRGALLLLLTVASISCIIIVATGAFGIESTDEVWSGTLIVGMSLLMIMAISVMETQYFCDELYYKVWNSTMSDTVSLPQDQFVCIIVYVVILVMIPIFYGFNVIDIVLLAAYSLFPIREHIIRKKLKALWTKTI